MLDELEAKRQIEQRTRVNETLSRFYAFEQEESTPRVDQKQLTYLKDLVKSTKALTKKPESFHDKFGGKHQQRTLRGLQDKARQLSATKKEEDSQSSQSDSSNSFEYGSQKSVDQRDKQVKNQISSTKNKKVFVKSSLLIKDEDESQTEQKMIGKHQSNQSLLAEQWWSQLTRTKDLDQPKPKVNSN